jgi:hypothetical protein
MMKEKVLLKRHYQITRRPIQEDSSLYKSLPTEIKISLRIFYVSVLHTKIYPALNSTVRTFLTVASINITAF